MASPVTDPALLAALNAPEPGKVTDPALLAALEAPAATPEAPSTLQTVREAIHAPTRALENGALLGLGDRARAAIDSVLSGFSGYGKHLEDERAETKAFHDAHPIAAPALEAVGGAIAPLAVVKAASVPTTMLGKSLAGAGAGGGIGAAQGALGSEDYTNPVQVAKDAAIGGAGGAVVGGVMPGAAKAIGAGYNAVANLARGKVEGMSRGAGNHLISAVEADGGPAAVQAKLTELGPDATLADAGVALRDTASGAALNNIEARSRAHTTLKTRDEGTNARIQADVDKALGPYQGGDPQLVSDAIVAHRKALDSVNYPAALDNAPSVKIAPIMTELIDRIHTTPNGSMENKALTKLQDMLTKTEKQPVLDINGTPQFDSLGRQKWKDVPVSHDDANVLHKVKQELDNVIEYDAPGLGVPAGALKNQQATLKQMRGAVNSALEDQVPGYANANSISSALAKRAEAVKKGTQYLGSGKTTPSPERFAAEFDPLSQDEKVALAKGSRGEIERVIGTKANDLQALRGELQGEGGWNTKKLAIVHGQPAADELAGSVDRNLKFRDTYNKIVENSQTAQRTAIKEAMSPREISEHDIITPSGNWLGMGLTAAKRSLAFAKNSITESSRQKALADVAQALVEPGAGASVHLQSVIDALDRRKANAAGAETAGKLGSVVAALLGNAALRDGPMRRQQP